MKYKLLVISTAALLLLLVLGYHKTNNPEFVNQSISTENIQHSSTQHQQIQLSNAITSVVTQEALASGKVEQLIEAIDQVLNKKPCLSGSYIINKNKITLNHCEGIYNNTTKLSGVITLSNGNHYNYQNVVINYANGESLTANGLLSITKNHTQTLVSSKQLDFTSQEAELSNTLISVHYHLSNYDQVWTKLSANDASIAVKGDLKVTDSQVPDYHVHFSTMNNPFSAKINHNHVLSHPYQGVLSIVDLTRPSSLILLSSNPDEKTLRYSALVQNKSLIDQTIQWDNLTALTP